MNIDRADALALAIAALIVVFGYVVQFQLRAELVESCERGNVIREAVVRHHVATYPKARIPDGLTSVDCEAAVDKPWPF